MIESGSQDIRFHSTDSVKKNILISKALLFPTATLEPLGTDVVLGLAGLVAEKITHEICAATSMMHLPLFSYGNAVPFNAYEGCAGLKSDGFTNAVQTIAKQAFGWGVKKIFVVEVSTLLSDKRKSYKPLPQDIADGCKIVKLDILRIASKCSAVKLDTKRTRADRELLSLGKYLFPESVGNCAGNTTPDEEMRVWYKRGRDPQKLLKILPSGISQYAQQSSAEEGRLLFEHICKSCIDSINRESILTS